MARGRSIMARVVLASLLLDAFVLADWRLESSFFNMTVNVTNGSNLVYVDGLHLHTQAGWTVNLLATGAAKASAITQFSSTVCVGPGGEQYYPRHTARTTVNATLTSIRFLDLALETLDGKSTLGSANWTIQVSDDRRGFSWTSTISNHAACTAQRHALVFSTVAYGAQHYGALGSQVPSYVDLKMQMNESDYYGGCGTLPGRAADVCGPHGFDSVTSGWYGLASSTLRQQILLTPLGQELEMVLGGACTSFVSEKGQSDGTASMMALGCASESSSAVSSSTSLTVHLMPDGQVGSPYAVLNVSFPEKFHALVQEMQLFARVQNLWQGWIFGNNPASVPCLHEMGWFSWVQQMFDTGSRSHEALKQQMSWFAKSAVNASGYVYPRWNVGGYYDVIWGPLIDQVPHFILAMHGAATITGDAEWLSSVEPGMDRAAAYMLHRGLNASLGKPPNTIPGVPQGVFTTISSGLPDGQRHCTNWYDIIGFGGADSYVAVYSIIAMQAMAEVKAFLNKTEDAEQYRCIVQSAISAYSKAFWSEQHGFFADWVDIKGDKRFYMYADTQHLAVAYGIASEEQARAILAKFDQRYAAITQAFNIKRDDIWATPSSFYPIPNGVKDTVGGSHPPSAAGKAWGSMPSYEIGGSFFHSLGFEILARKNESYPLFERFMRRGFAKNRGWAQQLYWGSPTGKRKEELVGGDPLNNSLIAMWGFLQGLFGVRISLSEVAFLPDHTIDSEFEGAWWSFNWRGDKFCVVVRNARAEKC